MKKKIFGAIAVTLFLISPVLVMADPCVAGGADYDATLPCNFNTAFGGSSVNDGSPLPGVSVNDPTVSTQGTPFQATPQFANPLKDEYNTFPKFVAGVTKAAVDILMPFVALAFIWSGFLFVNLD